MNRRLRSFLRRRGATGDEIDRAERDGYLALLALDRELMPGRPQYTFAESATAAGVEPESALRLWRALGFPDPPDDARRFADADVEALVTLRDWFRSEAFPGAVSFEGLLQQVRVIGGATARIAEVLSDDFVGALRDASTAGLDDEQIATLVPESVRWRRLARLLDYTMRLQLRAALWRKLSGGGDELMAVGFVDLVGYTALSQELDAEELAELVGRFDALAYDTVAEAGGRVVKTIGDEVMFVAREPAAAARIALRLTARSAVDEVLPEARAGLAFGSVLIHEGDYYGPIVNLASRLVEMARPGSVLISNDLHDALEDDQSFILRRLWTRRIRDIGRVDLWSLREPAAVTEAAAEPPTTLG